MFRTVLIALLLLSSPAFTQGPDCGGPDHWAANTAFALMKNAGITNNVEVAEAKRIASEKIGKDLYHQVYDVKFTEYSGKVIEAIVVHDASSEECSMSDAAVFVVSSRLGDLDDATDLSYRNAKK